MDQKHSGFATSSFIISIIVAVLMFAVFIAAGVMEATTPGGIDENSASAIVIGLFMVLFLVLDLLAIGLGIAGLFQKERKKTLSVLGVIFSATTILATAALMVIGSMA